MARGARCRARGARDCAAGGGAPEARGGREDEAGAAAIGGRGRRARTREAEAAREGVGGRRPAPSDAHAARADATARRTLVGLLETRVGTARGGAGGERRTTALKQDSGALQKSVLFENLCVRTLMGNVYLTRYT